MEKNLIEKSLQTMLYELDSIHGKSKTRTFYDLDYEEIGLAMDGPHPPIFACVMRRAGMPKQLECHGFICQTSEDAIIIAANLYQSLLGKNHLVQSTHLGILSTLDRNYRQ